MPKRFQLIAERDGQVIQRIGDFDGMGSAKYAAENIHELNWPEGCEAVIEDREAGKKIFMVSEGEWCDV